MRIYWDQILVDTSGSNEATRVARRDPDVADLRSRGFSAEITPDGREPLVYDYSRVTQDSTWKVMPGRYTRPGDVRELLASTDDLFVTSRPGDEIALSFDASALPPLPKGCFAVVPLEQPTEALVKVIRDFKPHVLTTYDETGGYPHPDHIRCHEVSVAAYEAAGDYRLFPDAGAPWNVAKLYYNHGFLRQRMQVLQDEFAKHGQEGPFAKWLEKWDPDDDLLSKRVTTRIECAKYFAQRDEALLAHATQIDPKSFFFTTPMEWQQRLWPTEEFELARSRVPVSLPETDLFAGIEADDD